jgi:hypothetical protein
MNVRWGDWALRMTRAALSGNWRRLAAGVTRGAFAWAVVAGGPCLLSSPAQAADHDWSLETLERQTRNFDPWEGVVRGQQVDESIYDEPLATDRPDFTEASSVVGRGVLQLETGYTYFHDDEAGTEERTHSLPESLFRYGITDNIELRLVWNYLWTVSSTAGVTEREDGAEDLILGAKFALTSEQGWIPESAIILDFSTPTGGTGITGQHAEFGSNYLFSWGLPADRSLAGSVGYSTGTEFTTGPGPVVLEDRHNIFHSSVAYGIPLHEPWGAYFEYFGFYFDGLSGGRPEHYFDAGLTYLLNNDVQFDVRIGTGLNQAADDYFAGTGVSVRF